MRSTILTGDALEQLKTIPDGTVNTCVTSPPYYGLRQYLPDGSDLKSFEIGLEQTPEQYISKLVAVFREVRRVLRDDGTCFINIGDSYCGSTSETPSKRENSPIAKGTVASQENRDGRGDRTRAMMNNNIKQKDLIGIPWMLAFALRADGWYLRQDIIWAKPNPMPESVTDRCTKSHEYIFLLSKSKQYYYDAEAIAEPIAESTIDRGPVSFGGAKGRAYKPDANDPNFRAGNEQWGRTYDYTDSNANGKRNKRSVWTVSTKPFKGSHFAVFPQALIEPCILAGAPFDGLVLDPFTGSGTTAVTALQNGRNFIGAELNPKYVKLAERRIKRDGHYQERISV